MQAGQLNEIIKIYKPLTTVNEYGEQLQTWTEHTTTKANVTYAGGTRNVENGDVFFGYTKIFKTWKYVDVTEKMQVEWQNKRYRITSIEEVRQYNEKIITAELINT